MAELLECPTCSGKVSSEAQACPHCGQPMTMLDDDDDYVDSYEEEERQAAEQLAKRIPEAVRRNEVITGMYEQEVLASWGAPLAVSLDEAVGDGLEEDSVMRSWHYPDRELTFENGVLFSWGESGESEEDILDEISDGILKRFPGPQFKRDPRL